MKFRCLMLITLCLAFVGVAQEGSSVQPLAITLSRDNEGAAMSPLGYMRIEFKNVSGGDVRILRAFDDEKILRFWFSMVVVDTNGTPVLDLPMGGKIALRSTREHLLLKPQESFSFRFNSGVLVPKLAPGSYAVRMIYQNQYGEDCFRGKLESNSLDLKVTGTPDGSDRRTNDSHNN